MIVGGNIAKEDLQPPFTKAIADIEKELVYSIEVQLP